MGKLVSVVIPIYNVDKYLSECLESVINQTYKNLQIILVDDGSTDNSGKICDEYAAKDNRISVIHQKNQGAGAAKNTGLDLVKGEYLSLIDSDDYLGLNYYEVMVSTLEHRKVDIVQCLFKNVFVDKSIARYFNFKSSKERVISTERSLFELLYDWKYAIFWNKLFKTSLLKNKRFPVGRKIDDEFFTYKLICNAKKVVNINECLYYYRMRQSSVMNVNNNDGLITDRMDCFIERYNYVKSRFPKLAYDYYYHFSDFLLYTYNSEISDELKCILKSKLEEYPYLSENIFKRVRRKLKLKHLCIDKEIDCSKFSLFE